jgi:hypothetical protein
VCVCEGGRWRGRGVRALVCLIDCLLGGVMEVHEQD